ncbi:Tetratricopeptide repeat-containing protein [Asanoa ishikariensis]|uniref:Tetratricopeptide repeat-containing protein n=1 Tax=Asanoa ishikariensis TaxID=137265 RepID=A0A1H3UTA1_9ACTN|nr:tetratricopeptide repeat protein [Asanoa ishikariensis]SDZ65075.1 Tetratricopeptide repeat-containing protein [Asanoa ishikariensis]
MTALVLLPVVTNLATDALPDGLAGWGSVAVAVALGMVVTWFTRRRGAFTAAGSGGATDEVSGPGPVWNIPAPSRQFSGRAEELQAMACLSAVVLHGIPGVGKTQLARAYCQQQRADAEIGWWIAADDRLSVIAGLALLGRRLGIRTEDPEGAARETVQLLGERGRWLLVLDNAGTEEDLFGLIPPAGTGRLVITSRNPAFDRIAEPVPVTPFPRRQSAHFLIQRTGSADYRAAEEVAELVGNLPLALEQAAAYCALTGISLADYARRYRSGRARLHRTGAPPDRLPVEGTLRLAFRQAARRNAAAVQLLRLLAFMAPTAAVSRRWLVAASGSLPRQLARAARDPLALDATVAVLRQTALITVDTEQAEWSMHALTGDVIRDGLGRRRLLSRIPGNVLAFGSIRHLDPTLAWDDHRWVRVAIRFITASLPGDVEDPAAWTRMAAIVPHAVSVLAHAQDLGVADASSATLRNNMGRLLLRRGDYLAALPLLLAADNEAQSVFGVFDPARLAFQHDLAEALCKAGYLDEAQDLLESLSEHAGTVLGTDHVEVAMIANDLGVVHRALGRTEQARLLFNEAVAGLRAAGRTDTVGALPPELNLADLDLDDGDAETAIARYRAAHDTQVRHLGADHPQTLVTLSNLAEASRLTGQLSAAAGLHEQCLTSRRRVLGADHPATSVSMNNLAVTYQALGRADEAHQLLTSAVALHERALGERHASSRRMTDNLRQATTQRAGRT